MFQTTIRTLFAILLVLIFSTTSNACVGRTLYVGMLDNDEEQLLAETIAQIINERTGTTVKARKYSTRELLYQALQEEEEEKRIDIIIESAEVASGVLNIPRKVDLAQEYLNVKKMYKEKFDIVWLTPFRFTKNNPNASSFMASLVRQDVLVNFPLLPRVLNKLADAINLEEFTALVAKIKSGDKHKNIARDFLQNKKLI